MFKCIMLIALFSGVGVCSGGEISTTTEMGKIDVIRADYARINTRIESFDKNKDLKMLEITGLEIPIFEKTIGNEKNGLHEMRRMNLRLWINFLNKLDANIDPNYNPTDTPMWNVSVPGGSYPSGISPSDVKEPEIRTKYLKAIEENEKKSVRLNFQMKLHEISERLYPEAIKYIKRNHLNTSTDTNEAKHAIDQYIRKKDRKKRMEEDLQRKDK